MMRTGVFSNLTTNNSNRITDTRSRSTMDSVREYFEELLLDDDFDQIGRLDKDSDEYEIYRDLGALPGSYA